MPDEKRRVSLTCEEPKFIGLILHAPTGVIYEHQFGGTGCWHDGIEGYFVPVSRAEIDPDADVYSPSRHELDTDLLKAVFHHPDDPDRCWACSAADLPDENVERLAALIDLLCYYGGGYEMRQFELDRLRLADGREAYVPVLTPDGPGLLVWNNCD